MRSPMALHLVGNPWVSLDMRTVPERSKVSVSRKMSFQVTKASSCHSAVQSKRRLMMATRVCVDFLMRQPRMTGPHELPPVVKEERGIAC